MARASLSCLNPMGTGRVQGRGEFQFVCFSNKLWGQELACSCSVILFLSEPAFFFCFLFLFSLSPEASPIQMLLLRSPEGESNGCFWSIGDCLPFVDERPVWGVNDKFIFFCLERLAWPFSGQTHLKDMIEQFHLGRFSFTVSRDAFRVPLPGMPSDIKRGMISLDCSLQRKI